MVGRDEMPETFAVSRILIGSMGRPHNARLTPKNFGSLALLSCLYEKQDNKELRASGTKLWKLVDLIARFTAQQLTAAAVLIRRWLLH